MGLFDFIFGSSKKEQGRPIRDKLKDRKHFERILKARLDEINTDKESLSEIEVHKLFICRVIAYHSMDVIQIRYSMDGGLQELKGIYLDSLKYFIVGYNCNNPIYFDILNRVSLAILLNIPEESFMQLVDYVQRMDEQAKPSDWTPDLLLWFLLNSRLKDDEEKTHAQRLAFPRLYRGLYKVIQAPNGETAKKALMEYIGKWYGLNKDAPWYNNHLRGTYRGYWAWEVAAVAKIMHIDDSELKDNPYYPYDMVHWEDGGEENAGQADKE